MRIKGEKTSKKSAVAATNDACTLSKVSMSNAGYVTDPFVKYFVTKTTCRRSPIINRGYFTRAFAIDYWIHAFLTSVEQSQTTAQVISLGAGFDTLYFRSLRTRVCVQGHVEIDLPSVIDRKMQLITHHWSKLVENVELDIKQLSDKCTQLDQKLNLLACDLRDLKQLDRQLFSDIGLDHELPTLILAECSLTYLSEKYSDRAIEYFCSKFNRHTLVLYEQIRPHDSFGCFMKEHFSEVGSPLRTIDAYPTIGALERRFQQLAPGSVTCIADLNTFYNMILSHDRKVMIEQLEPFDEFELFALKCAHYIVATVCSAQFRVPSLESAFRLVAAGVPVQTSLAVTAGKALPESIVPMSSSSLQRFCHAVSFIGTLKCVVVSGGVGVSPSGSHARLSSLHIISIGSMAENSSLKKENNLSAIAMHGHSQQTLIDVPSPRASTDAVIVTESALERCYHLQLSITEEKVLIVGGRKSPFAPWDSVVVCNIVGPLILGNNERSGIISSAAVTTNTILTKYPCDQINFTPCWRLAGCAIGSGLGFVAGGRTVDQVLRQCYIVEVSTEDAVPPIFGAVSALPLALHSHSCAFDALSQSVVITGGLTEDNTASGSLLIFDLKLGSWSEIKEHGIDARFGHTSHIVNDKLILCGGTSHVESACDLSASVHMFDMKTFGLLRKIALSEQNLMLVNHQTVMADNSLWIIGGGGNCFSFGTFLNRNLSSLSLCELGI